jgi:xanthine/uracil permease
MINAALIWAGIATFVQVYQFRIPGINMAIGTGVLSVTGISFTFMTPVLAYVNTYMVSCTQRALHHLIM